MQTMWSRSASARTGERVVMVALAASLVGPVPLGARAQGTTDCLRYGSAHVSGQVAIPGVHEISGVVASHRDDVLWVEQDSGNPEEIWAIDASGAVRADIQVRDATNHDWEDIALTRHRLWLGDIGDNHLRRESIQVYWFPEPALDTGSVDARMVTLTYPDGPHNAEAMFVDWHHRTLFIITKTRAGAAVFRTQIAHLHNGEARSLRQVATLPLNLVTAADIGPRGIIVKAGDGYLYPWRRDGRVLTALARTPCGVSVGPGESIAFSRDERGLFAIPEGQTPNVYYTPPATG
jgi:hypothetical protein